MHFLRQEELYGKIEVIYGIERQRNGEGHIDRL